MQKPSELGPARGPMPLRRDNNALALEPLAATGLVAVGFLTGLAPLASLAGLASGIGGNWAASLVERGFQHWSTQWGRELGVGSGPLADGLSLALERAVARVMPGLEREDRYLGLRHRDWETAEALRDGLQVLGENAAIVVSRAGAQAMEEGWAQEGTTTCEREGDW